MTPDQADASTRQLLIDAAVRRLWNHDESEIRILDICKDTGFSTSLIYGNFHSRQGLIDAALLEIFSQITSEMADAIERQARSEHPTGLYVDTLFRFLRDPAHRDAITRQRKMFFRVSANALARPSIRDGFLAIYNDYHARVDAIYQDLTVTGALSDGLTGRQWALLLEGHMLSRAFHDLSLEWDDQDDWYHATERIFPKSPPKPLPTNDSVMGQELRVSEG